MSAVRDFWVHVNGPRAADFAKVFGRPIVAIRSPQPQMARLPGFDEPQLVYFLDLEWAAEQGYRQALVDHIAGRFGLAAGDVDRDLDEIGMPILATDVTLRIDRPERWMC